MRNDIFVDQIDRNKYFVATYKLRSHSALKKAAWELAVGQSVGNPNVRNRWETDQLFEDYCCVIENTAELEKDSHVINEGIVKIGFPYANTDFHCDGFSHLLCQLMGGQLDISNITGCRLIDLEFNQQCQDKHFHVPKYGINDIRKFTEVYNKPLLGAIIKPKTGMSSNTLLDIVKELVDNGVNFIKEDEILSNPSFCPLVERAPKITKYLSDKRVIYTFCINSDPLHIFRRVQYLTDLAIPNGVHVNIWSGFGVYRSIRELDKPLFLHYQKSGDKILTNKHHDFSISWSVLCKLAVYSGVDFIHAGMWGGYSNDDEVELHEVMDILRRGQVMPALSCGMHPGLVNATTAKFGNDYMANVGGAIHGHPGGTGAGVRAMRQAIDGDYKQEYYDAIDKWGLQTPK